jgi:hypothetical protein
MKGILSDLRTNIQEALRPIDSIGTSGAVDTELESLKRTVKDLSEQNQNLVKKLAAENLKHTEEVLDIRKNSQTSIAQKDAEIRRLQGRLAENDPCRAAVALTDAPETSDWQRRYEAALQAIGELEERLEETQEENSMLRDELRKKIDSSFS